MKTVFTFIATFLVTLVYSQHCISKIATGLFHVVVQKTDGSLLVWGSGGTLGNGDSNNEFSPISLGTGTNWLDINCGGGNVFAIRNDHTLWGTGNNTYGTLGTGNTSPVTLNWLQIGTASNWAKVSGADYSTIALKTNGTLWGWGQNAFYQMGNGTCCADVPTPIQIHPDTDWVSIETSQYGVGFAIKSNGTLWGWGSNCGGILVGANDVPHRPFITQLTPDTNWKTISVGACHALALKTDNTLWSWGANEYGQLGNNVDVGSASTEPTQVGTDTWKCLATGFGTSYGIKTNGTLWAWGKNDVGQLGLGNTTNQTVPVQVGTASDWESVACGGFDFAIALKSNGSVYSWGQNDYGQLGNGTTNPQLVPTMVISCPLNAESFTTNKVSFHPNPAKDVLHITVANTIISSINIYNVTGQLVFSVMQPSDTISVSELKTGTYFVKVNFENETETITFIKE